MNSLKRIFFTIKAHLDEVADDFENHEALAGVAIKELEAYQGKTRIHQHRLQGMIEQFESKLAVLDKEAQSWSARAVKLKIQDETKALECVKRLLQVQKQMKEIEAELAKSKKQLGHCHNDLEKIQSQLNALYTQKEVLSARQNRIQLQSRLHNGHVDPTTGTNEIFKRWENSVISAELVDPIVLIKDSFADEFDQAEKASELKILLDELASKQSAE